MSPTFRMRRTPRFRRGVTALEALLSVAVVSTAGAALLSGIGSTVRSSREIALTTVARGLADQLLNEAAALPVPSGTAPAAPSGPRSAFTVVDQFGGWSESPPVDRHGRALGTEGIFSGGTSVPRPSGLRSDAAFMACLGRTVSVEKVVPSGAGWVVTGSSTPFRRVVVRVSYSESGRSRILVETSRIVCHVGPAV